MRWERWKQGRELNFIEKIRRTQKTGNECTRPERLAGYGGGLRMFFYPDSLPGDITITPGCPLYAAVVGAIAYSGQVVVRVGCLSDSLRAVRRPWGWGWEGDLTMCLAGPIESIQQHEDDNKAETL
jgi:hypothetical protein